jgi:hypothetical protein
MWLLLKTFQMKMQIHTLILWPMALIRYVEYS